MADAWEHGKTYARPAEVDGEFKIVTCHRNRQRKTTMKTVPEVKPVSVCAGQLAGQDAIGLNRSTFIGDKVGHQIVFADLATVIGSGAPTSTPFADAVKAAFGVDTVNVQDVSGRILLQMGSQFFDMRELLEAAEKRQAALAEGVPNSDLWHSRDAVQTLKANYGKKDN